MEQDELLYTIAMKLHLGMEEYDMLIHDVNNLRGNEWIETVEQLNDEELIQEFKELVSPEDDEEE